MSTHTPEELNALYLETGRVYWQLNGSPADWAPSIEKSKDGITWIPFRSDGSKGKFLRLAPTPEDRAKAEQIASNEKTRLEWEAGGRRRVAQYRYVDRSDDDWWNVVAGNPAWGDERLIFRLRPEPVYVPYSFADECWTRTPYRTPTFGT